MTTTLTRVTDGPSVEKRRKATTTGHPPPPAESTSRRWTAWWSDRGIKVKVLVAVAVPLIGSAAIGLTGISSMSAVATEAHSLYDVNVQAVAAKSAINYQLNLMRLASRDTVLAGDAEAAHRAEAAFDTASAGFDDAVKSYESLDIGTAARELLSELTTTADDYRTVQATVLMPIALTGDTAEWSKQNTLNADALTTKLRELLESLEDATLQDAQHAVTDIDADASDNRIVAIVTIVIAIGLSVALGLAVASGIGRATRKVLGVVDGVAAGDLTGTTGLSTRDEMGRMGAALDRATASLREVMSAVVGGADSLASSSEELSASSTQISSAAEETSAQAGVVAAASEQVSTNVQTVSAAAEEMAVSIQEIASNAADAATVAGRAVEAAQSASGVMHELDKSSGEIGKVISLITSIADQTNLLALNATIEAARAGESGKGFAVVANEVKELAQESAKAASEISRLVEGIQHDTSDAVTAIDQIGQTIGQISDRQATIASAVEQQTATTQEITRSVSEAASGVGEIASNITGVSTAAGSTTEALGQSAVVVTELSRMASDLRVLVSRFTY